MDEILNSNSISDVRFRMSKPQGYYAEDVDKFIDEQVKGSLAAYELEIKELQANIYSLEMQVKDQDNELSTLRMKADFSQSNAIDAEDSLIADAIAKQERLELENTKLREAIKEWEQWAESVEQTLNEQTQTVAQETAEPVVEEAVEPESVYAPEPAVEAVEEIVEPEPVYAPEPAVEAVEEIVEPEHSFTAQPIKATAPVDTAEEISEKDKALKDIMLSVESEISEEELRKVLEEVGEADEDDLYMKAEDVKPEDL